MSEEHAPPPQSLQMMRMFSEEFKFSCATLSKDDTEYGRRMFVRAYFSAFEAALNGMAYLLTESDAASKGIFTPEEIVLLREESCNLDDKGEMRIRPKQMSPCAKVRFLFRCAAKLMRTDFKLNVSEGNGWEGFKTAVKLRNRITHPHSPEDFAVSKEDIRMVLQAHLWFKGEFQRLSAPPPTSSGAPPA